MNTDQNTFAEQSWSYASARPRYPMDLFRWISGQCESHRNAWDCATGNGQAAVALADYFAHVDATDISAAQIACALPHSGIGLATARRFVAEGAYVFITGRRQAELEEAVRQIGRHVTGVQGDVANLADLDRLFDKVKRQQGRLDVLFANAGVLSVAPLGSIT